MCRIFAYASKTPLNLEVYFHSAPNSLEKQSVKHADGWGIGYYDSSQLLRVLKEPFSAKEDQTFDELSHVIHSNLLITHIRKATLGSKKRENCHPFSYKHFAMAHNGKIREFKKLKPYFLKKIDTDLQRSIKGTTDSEVLFYLFLSLLRKECKQKSLEHTLPKHIKGALFGTIQEVCTLHKTHAPQTQKPILNIAVLDSKNIYATTMNRKFFVLELDEKSHPEHIHALHWHMRFGEDTKKHSSVLLASEVITDHDKWGEVPNNSFLWIRENGTVHVEPLPDFSESTFLYD